jgi:hypothetical protein
VWGGREGGRGAASCRGKGLWGGAGREGHMVLGQSLGLVEGSAWMEQGQEERRSKFGS